MRRRIRPPPSASQPRRYRRPGLGPQISIQARLTGARHLIGRQAPVFGALRLRAVAAASAPARLATVRIIRAVFQTRSDTARGTSSVGWFWHHQWPKKNRQHTETDRQHHPLHDQSSPFREINRKTSLESCGVHGDNFSIPICRETKRYPGRSGAAHNVERLILNQAP